MLSRGVQHSRDVVRALSLDALAAVARALQPLTAAVAAGRAATAAAAAAAAAAGAGGDVTAASSAAVVVGAWSAFHRRLRGALRSRLPDLQTLLALHTAVDREQQAADGAAAAAGGQDGPKSASHKSKGPENQRPRQKKEAKGDVDMDMDVGAGAQAPDAEADTEDEEGEDGEEGSDAQAVRQELLAAVFGAEAAEQPAAVRGAVLVRLLGVCADYVLLLPDAAAEARFDPVKLIPAVSGRRADWLAGCGGRVRQRRRWGGMEPERSREGIAEAQYRAGEPSSRTSSPEVSRATLCSSSTTLLLITDMVTLHVLPR